MTFPGAGANRPFVLLLVALLSTQSAGHAADATGPDTSDRGQGPSEALAPL
jgi:hypothetical protein